MPGDPSGRRGRVDVVRGGVRGRADPDAADADGRTETDDLDPARAARQRVREEVPDRVEPVGRGVSPTGIGGFDEPDAEPDTPTEPEPTPGADRADVREQIADQREQAFAPGLQEFRQRQFEAEREQAEEQFREEFDPTIHRPRAESDAVTRTQMQLETLREQQPREIEHRGIPEDAVARDALEHQQQFGEGTFDTTGMEFEGEQPVLEAAGRAERRVRDAPVIDETLDALSPVGEAVRDIPTQTREFASPLTSPLVSTSERARDGAMEHIVDPAEAAAEEAGQEIVADGPLFGDMPGTDTVGRAAGPFVGAFGRGVADITVGAPALASDIAGASGRAVDDATDQLQEEGVIEGTETLATGAGAAGVGGLQRGVQAFRDDPVEATAVGGGMAAAGLGVGTALSPVRFERMRVPRREGTDTTVTGVTLRTPIAAEATLPRRFQTRQTVGGFEGRRPVAGTPQIRDLDDVDVERMGTGKGQDGPVFEPITPFESDVVARSVIARGDPVDAERMRAGTALLDDAETLTGGVRARRVDDEDVLDTVRAAEDVPAGTEQDIVDALADVDATIFGSGAVRAQEPDFRRPGDVDIVVPDADAARTRLSRALDDTDRSVDDVFDVKETADFAGLEAGEEFGFGRFSREPVGRGDIRVNPIGEELQRKTGASLFLRGDEIGRPGVDVGPRPARGPDTPVRQKDPRDAAAIGEVLGAPSVGEFRRAFGLDESPAPGAATRPQTATEVELDALDGVTGRARPDVDRPAAVGPGQMQPQTQTLPLVTDGGRLLDARGQPTRVTMDDVDSRVFGPSAATGPADGGFPSPVPPSPSPSPSPAGSPALTSPAVTIPDMDQVMPSSPPPAESSSIDIAGAAPSPSPSPVADAESPAVSPAPSPMPSPSVPPSAPPSGAPSAPPSTPPSAPPSPAPPSAPPSTQPPSTPPSAPPSAPPPSAPPSAPPTAPPPGPPSGPPTTPPFRFDDDSDVEELLMEELGDEGAWRSPIADAEDVLADITGGPGRG